MQREYDIVLLGATGFTGSLMVEYMTATFPGSLRWAIAARNKAKLDEVARKYNVEASGGYWALKQWFHLMLIVSKGPLSS